jgi:lantibiotic modifying enzyme
MTDNRQYLQAAERGAAWLMSKAIPVDGGIAWPSDPDDPNTVSTGTYAGNAGVILFFLELFAATGDERYREHAAGGGDYLLGKLDSEEQLGLYGGFAGEGFALMELAKAGAGDRFLEGAKRCAEELRSRAEPVGAGVEWAIMTPDPLGSPDGPKSRFVSTDIISGAAGIASFLLYAARELDDPTLRELAAAAGRRLVEIGEVREGGLDWQMADGFPYRMPNFSHGTAGIAFLLASLANELDDEAFRDAAIAGGRYLQAIAITDGDVCLVPHAEPPQTATPDEEPVVRYALSWCHGPMGVGSTWYRLYQATGDKEWLSWLDRSARSFVPGAIPDALEGNVARTEAPGTWPSVCYCHGSAGNGAFLLNAFQATGDETYRDVAFRMIDDCVSRGIDDGDGIKWEQGTARWNAETNSYDPATFAQTGFSTGVAGVGYALLAFDAFEQGRPLTVVFPDSPF